MSIIDVSIFISKSMRRYPPIFTRSPQTHEIKISSSSLSCKLPALLLTSSALWKPSAPLFCQLSYMLLFCLSVIAALLFDCSKEEGTWRDLNL
jgi:hypothetical protein